METGIKWMQIIFVTSFVHFVYYDIQLTKINKEIKKEKKYAPGDNL